MSSQICGLSNHHTDRMFSNREMTAMSFKRFCASVTRRQRQLERTVQHKVAYSLFLLGRQSQLPTLKLAWLRQTVDKITAVHGTREGKKKETYTLSECNNQRNASHAA